MDAGMLFGELMETELHCFSLSLPSFPSPLQGTHTQTYKAGLLQNKKISLSRNRDNVDHFLQGERETQRPNYDIPKLSAMC